MRSNTHLPSIAPLTVQSLAAECALQNTFPGARASLRTISHSVCPPEAASVVRRSFAGLAGGCATRAPGGAASPDDAAAHSACTSSGDLSAGGGKSHSIALIGAKMAALSEGLRIE